jgi:hypothetical protein
MTEDGMAMWRRNIKRQEEGRSKTRRVWLGTLEEETRIKLPDKRSPKLTLVTRICDTFISFIKCVA